nr:dienelactone hydrolase family protein [Amycolatopsis acididurans]
MARHRHPLRQTRHRLPRGRRTPRRDHLDQHIVRHDLGLFGVDDQYPSTEEVRQLSAELERHGKPHEFHTYEGAGHAFFAVDRPSYRPEAANEGWRRVFDFFGTNLATA